MDPFAICTVCLFAGLGSCLGIVTGLIPGIHVNTLASISLMSYSPMLSALSSMMDPGFVPVAICSTIMSASVVHSFVDFVPSVFIGAPDGEDLVSVLPGHRLLLSGHGMAAVRSAAVGSLVGCSAAIVMAIPLQLVMINGGSEYLDGLTWYILLSVVALLLFNEWRNGSLMVGIVATVLSGALGYAVMNLPIPDSGLIGEGTLLLPMLTGLFGLPVLLESDTDNPLPRQTDDGADPVGIVPGLKGVLMGTVAGWFPGITSTVGATVSSTILPERTPERFISTVASIGTVTAVLSLVTLSVSGGGRSGTVIVIGEILGESIRGFASEPFMMMLISAAIASVIGYVVTIKAGRSMVGLVSRIQQKSMNRAIIVFLMAIVLVTTGLWGILILAISLTIGYIPVRFGCGRTVLCGCLIVPCLI